MDLTITQKKKHILLFNRLYRQALKEELVPTPSKLSDDKIEKLFDKLFMKKDHYYVPKMKNQLLVIDEDEFKKLYKEPKKQKQPKEEVKKPMEEPKKEEPKAPEPKKEEIRKNKNVFAIIESLDKKPHDLGVNLNEKNIIDGFIYHKLPYYLILTENELEKIKGNIDFVSALNPRLKKVLKIITNKKEIDEILNKIYESKKPEPMEEPKKEEELKEVEGFKDAESLATALEKVHFDMMGSRLTIDNVVKNPKSLKELVEFMNKTFGSFRTKYGDKETIKTTLHYIIESYNENINKKINSVRKNAKMTDEEKKEQIIKLNSLKAKFKGVL